MRQPRIAVGQKENQQFGRLIGLATAGAVAYSIASPLLHLYAIAAEPVEHGRALYAAAATLSFVPIQVWLVVQATRSAHIPRKAFALSALGILLFVMLPVVGVQWTGNLYMLAALVLVSVRPPGSYFFYAALVAAMAPVTFSLGHPEWAGFYTLGMLFIALPFAVVIWFIRAARQLQAARLSLAEDAVVRERLRIDTELRMTVGAELDAIAAIGDRAGDLAINNPAAAGQQMRDLVDAARRTLADARRLVASYRDVSWRAELETAATLLSAAGIDVRLDVPAGDIYGTINEKQRATLRREVTRLVADELQTCVTIRATSRDGQVGFEVLAGALPSPTEVTAG